MITDLGYDFGMEKYLFRNVAQSLICVFKDKCIILIIFIIFVTVEPALRIQKSGACYFW